jgi:hypothetical protein
MVIDLSLTDPEGFDNSKLKNNINNYSEAIIWEVHVRDFSNKIASSKYKGKYLAFTETGLKNEHGVSVGIDYLKNLGITHVHLLPVYDYATVDEANPEAEFNWGYDPKNYNVPEGSYSTDPYNGEVRIKEYKQMIAALHEAGIANAVSTIGGGLGARQARSLVAAGAREVTLLYPDDTHVGEAAAVASLPQAFMETKVAWAPADVGDLMQREGVSKDKLLRACDAAGGLLEGVVGRVAERCDLDDPGRLLEGVREACGLLAFAANRDEARAHILASSIADRFGVRDVDALMGPLLDGTQIGDESWRTERARDAHPHAVEAWKLEHRALSADALCSHGATRSPAQRVTARKPMEGVKVAGEGFRVGYAHANRGIAAQLLEETQMRRDNGRTTYGAGNLRPTLGIRHNEGTTMEERQIIMISRGLGEPRGVSLATKEEIQRMGDLQAIAKIDELRDAAKEAENVGLVGEACTLYANACDIVENNLIVPEVIGEYADMLEAHGMSEQAADYRAWHEEFTKVLAEYDLPARGYEARLRDQVAQASQGAAGRDNPGEQSVRRERLGDAVAQAQSAARAIEAPAGHALPSVTRAGA